MNVTINAKNITVDDAVYNIAEIANFERAPLVKLKSWQSQNPANILDYDTTIMMNMASGRSHAIVVKNVSNQITWFNPAWTLVSQLDAGVKQALSDLGAALN